MRPYLQWPNGSELSASLRSPGQVVPSPYRPGPTSGRGDVIIERRCGSCPNRDSLKPAPLKGQYSWNLTPRPRTSQVASQATFPGHRGGTPLSRSHVAIVCIVVVDRRFVSPSGGGCLVPYCPSNILHVSHQGTFSVGDPALHIVASTWSPSCLIATLHGPGG